MAGTSSSNAHQVEFGQKGASGGLNLNELKAGVMFAKKELKAHSNALHGLLGNKNDNGKKQMSEPDHLQLVAEARSGQLLHQAVQVQTALDQLVHAENGVFREMKSKVDEAMNTFEHLFSKFGSIVDQAIERKSTMLKREINAVRSKAHWLNVISRKLANEIIIGKNNHGKNNKPPFRHTKEQQYQSEFNHALQELAQLITQKPNRFLQLQVAQQVLDRASTLIEAIGANWVEEKEEKGEKRNNKSQQAGRHFD